MLKAFLSVYAGTWQFLAASWKDDGAAQEHALSSLQKHFSTIEVAPNLMLNVLTYNLFFLVLLRAGGFSDGFQLFSCLCISAPSVIGSWAYYYYKYGAVVWFLNWRTLAGWVNNAYLMVAIAGVSWTMNVSLYYVLLTIQKALMPSWLQAPFAFPLDVIETYFQRCVYIMYAFGCVLLVTVPLWMKAYRMNMKLTQRSGHISVSEMCIEILYFTCQWATFMQFVIPAAPILAKLGLEFHVIHYLAGFTSVALANWSINLKFTPLHKMFHKIRPLYNMVHYEHHICKSIHPNSSGVGCWETFVFGGDLIPSELAFLSLPYLSFFMAYFGGGLINHTMVPDLRCVQWHTLHHVVVADVYGLNKPTISDEKYSVDFQKYDPILKETSPMVKYWWLSDAAALLIASVTMLCFHYGMGWSIVNVWHTAQWG